jgi:hypothetical protein
VTITDTCEQGVAMLYNFVTRTEEEVDLKHLTDEQAVRYLPDSPVTRGCYHLLRAQGYEILEALTDLLKLHLVAGGQRRVVPQHNGGG